MVGAHQNLNGSRYLTTPLSGIVAIRVLALATFKLPTKFEVSISIHYEDMRGNKNVERRWFGLVRVIQGHWK